MEMNPKILLGCPTFEGKKYCLSEFAEGIRNMSYKNFDVLLVENSKTDNYYNEIKSRGLPVARDVFLETAKERIVHSRNLLREKVLNEGYDYLFSLEQDVVAPKDVLQRLLAHNKKIITGLYFKYEIINDKMQMSPLIYKALTADSIRELTEGEHGEEVIEEMKRNGIFDSQLRIPFTFEQVEEPRLMKIDFCGLGCILIHRDVLENIRFRADIRSFDDMFFCEDARTAGYEIWADTSVKCRHFLSEQSWKNIKM
ncbi:MAG TPA: hypothetical protein VI894_03805 [Candidatus Nanoarchaeia archaeon]|nr:hypothetical protein [Candidatus Nanoarchaeia archaeon]